MNQPNQQRQEEVKTVKNIPTEAGHTLPAQKSNLRDIINNAPVVAVNTENPLSKQPAAPVKQPPQPQAQPAANPPQAPVQPQTVPQQPAPAVQPGSNQQANVQAPQTLPNPDQQTAELQETAAEPQQPIPLPAQVQIGDNVYQSQDILQAIKTHQGKEEWIGEITRKNQVVNYFKPDELQNLAKYVVKREELPKDFMKTVDLPKSFEVDDGDGGTISVALSDIPAEVIEKMEQQIAAKTIPELLELRGKYQELNKAVEIQRQQAIEAGEQQAHEFAKLNPDLAITVPPGYRFSDVLMDIIETAGPKHPEYENAVRLGTVLQTAYASGITPEQAYKMHYGREAQRKAAIAAVQANQHYGPMGEIPTGQPAPVTDNFEARVQNPKTKRIAEFNDLAQRVT